MAHSDRPRDGTNSAGVRRCGGNMLVSSAIQDKYVRALAEAQEANDMTCSGLPRFLSDWRAFSKGLGEIRHTMGTRETGR
jgi:hypothetical protein